jgi:hypothetical protein
MKPQVYGCIMRMYYIESQDEILFDIGDELPGY